MRGRLLISAAVLLIAACGAKKADNEIVQENSKALITFVELGSVNCIPCKAMQPVMKSIETKYEGQVEVIFHDVREDRSIGQKFGIRLIPTQVFLDSSGQEIMRHQGFFPEKDIDRFLQEQGLHITQGK